MSKSQEDLINFVTSEDALRKAAEGSMEKRAAVLCPQEDAELRDILNHLLTNVSRYDDWVGKGVELLKARDERRERELYTKDEVIAMVGEDLSCSTCTRLIHPTKEWFCENCEALFHEGCEGYSYSGSGEYPAESAYALCVTCADPQEQDKEEE